MIRLSGGRAMFQCNSRCARRLFCGIGDAGRCRMVAALLGLRAAWDSIRALLNPRSLRACVRAAAADPGAGRAPACCVPGAGQLAEIKRCPYRGFVIGVGAWLGVPWETLANLLVFW